MKRSRRAISVLTFACFLPAARGDAQDSHRPPQAAIERLQRHLEARARQRGSSIENFHVIPADGTWIAISRETNASEPQYFEMVRDSDGWSPKLIGGRSIIASDDHQRLLSRAELAARFEDYPDLLQTLQALRTLILGLEGFYVDFGCYPAARSLERLLAPDQPQEPSISPFYVRDTSHKDASGNSLEYRPLGEVRRYDRANFAFDCAYRYELRTKGPDALLNTSDDLVYRNQAHE